MKISTWVNCLSVVELPWIVIEGEVVLLFLASVNASELPTFEGCTSAKGCSAKNDDEIVFLWFLFLTRRF